jgi:hypothetical protein
MLAANAFDFDIHQIAANSVYPNLIPVAPSVMQTSHNGSDLSRVIETDRLTPLTVESASTSSVISTAVVDHRQTVPKAPKAPSTEPLGLRIAQLPSHEFTTPRLDLIAVQQAMMDLGVPTKDFAQPSAFMAVFDKVTSGLQRSREPFARAINLPTLPIAPSMKLGFVSVIDVVSDVASLLPGDMSSAMTMTQVTGVPNPFASAAPKMDMRNGGPEATMAGPFEKAFIVLGGTAGAVAGWFGGFAAGVATCGGWCAVAGSLTGEVAGGLGGAAAGAWFGEQLDNEVGTADDNPFNAKTPESDTNGDGKDDCSCDTQKDDGKGDKRDKEKGAPRNPKGGTVQQPNPVETDYRPPPHKEDRIYKHEWVADYGPDGPPPKPQVPFDGKSPTKEDRLAPLVRPMPDDLSYNRLRNGTEEQTVKSQLDPLVQYGPDGPPPELGTIIDFWPPRTRATAGPAIPHFDTSGNSI